MKTKHNQQFNWPNRIPKKWKIQSIIANISKIKTLTIVIKLKSSSRQKNLQNPKHQTIKILITLYFQPFFKVLEEKEIDEKENQHDEQGDLISCSADQPQNRDRV